MFRILLLAYLFLAGVTWTVSGELEAASIIGRIVFADLVLCGLVVLGFRYVINRPIPRLALAALGLIAIFGSCTAVAHVCFPEMLQIELILVEFLVHLFLIFGFIAIHAYASSLPIEGRISLLVWWARAGGILAIIGLWDLFAPYVGIPLIGAGLGFHLGHAAQGGDVVGGVSGTFRNTGQAGTFYHTVLCCTIPTWHAVKGSRKPEMLFWTIVLILAVLLTVKRAAILGLAAGLVALALTAGINRFAKTLMLVSVGATLVYLSAAWLLDSSYAFGERIERKVTIEATSLHEGFLADNLSATVRSLQANPLTGAGMFGTMIDERWEVHSTYLKMLADYGLIGALAYAGFTVLFFRTCLIPQNQASESRQLARIFLPLLLGLMLSWGYTYHLRKREYWISAALISGMMAPVANQKVFHGRFSQLPRIPQRKLQKS